LGGWVVRVWEPEPPPDVEPLEWVRLPSVPCPSPQQGCRARGVVPCPAFGSRTPPKGSKRAVPSKHATCRPLRDDAGCLGCFRRWPCASSNCVGRPAKRLSGPASRSCQLRWCRWWRLWHTEPVQTSRVEQGWHLIAAYGGYLGRKGEGPPGWKTLWKGWFSVQAVLDGVQVAARLWLDPSSFP
jgi:hypothetical protein